MAEIIKLPDNLIGIDDHESLESFGGHEISHGRMTRFHWDKESDGDPVFEMYYGGANEKLFSKIIRDRKKDEFQAHDSDNKIIVSGTLNQVMSVLDERLATKHGENDD